MEIKSKRIERIIKNKVPIHIRLQEARAKNRNKHKPVKYEGSSKEEIMKLRGIKKLFKK